MTLIFKGADLPTNIWNHRMVAFEDRIYVVGGADSISYYRDQILQYQCAQVGDCAWNEIVPKLKHARLGHIVIPIDDEQEKRYCHCNKKSDGVLERTRFTVTREAKYYQCFNRYLTRHLKLGSRWEWFMY